MLGFKAFTDIVDELRQINRKLQTMEKITIQQYKALQQVKYCLKDHQRALEMLFREQKKDNTELQQELKMQFNKLAAILEPQFHETGPHVKLTFGEKEDLVQ